VLESNCVTCKEVFEFDDSCRIETCDFIDGQWHEFDVTFCPECDTENRI